MATKVLPIQRQFKQFEEQVILGQLALPEVIRRGAQLMLQHAVELEMTEYLGREYYHNDTETTAARGRRNGYRTRPVRTGEGSLEIQLSEVRDVPPGRPRFQSKILEAYVSRTESLETRITRMYVAGMSTRDIETAFVDLLSGHGVSRSTVSRITERLNEDLEQFRTTDLSGHDVLYLILGGTYIKYRVEAERKEPILVAYGYRTDTYDHGLRLGREVIERFRDQYPSAMACLEEDLEACLQVLRLPEEHRRRMRTSNGLERLFGENRRRVKVIPHFFTEKAGIKLVYATLVAASQNWRGVTVTPEIAQVIDELWEEVYLHSRIETWAA